MLALQSAQDKSADGNATSASAVCTPNILPCRIHHDGPVEVSERYWNPVKDDNGKTEIQFTRSFLLSLTSISINAGNGQAAYFRGRKLRGRRVELPEGYEGG